MTIKELERGYNVCRKTVREFYDIVNELETAIGTAEGSECCFAEIAARFAKCAKRMEILGDTYGQDMAVAADVWGSDGWVKEMVIREMKEGEGND